MNWGKITVVILASLALIQFAYWGYDDCSACDFGNKNIKQFYKEYKEQCLKEIEYQEIGQINLTQVEPLKLKEPMEYKNETKDV